MNSLILQSKNVVEKSKRKILYKPILLTNRNILNSSPYVYLKCVSVKGTYC